MTRNVFGPKCQTLLHLGLAVLVPTPKSSKTTLAALQEAAQASAAAAAAAAEAEASAAEDAGWLELTNQTQAARERERQEGGRKDSREQQRDSSPHHHNQRRQDGTGGMRVGESWPLSRNRSSKLPNFCVRGCRVYCALSMAHSP